MINYFQFYLFFFSHPAFCCGLFVVNTCFNLHFFFKKFDFHWVFRAANRAWLREAVNLFKPRNVCLILQKKVIITTCTVTGPQNNHRDWTKEIFAHQSFKGCVRYILAILFLSLNESTCGTRKNVFYFILFQKLFAFSRK